MINHQQNMSRARRARSVLATYVSAHKPSSFSEFESLTDLLTDLRHLYDTNPTTMRRALDTSERHYREETTE